MLLNAQGCSHAADLIDLHGAEDNTAAFASDGRTSLEAQSAAASRESDAKSGMTTEGEDDDDSGDENLPKEQHETAGVQADGAVSDSRLEKSCCRCRQAMRLLTRLVRGLPGETPAVVVRHSGLQNIVQILKDGAAVASSGGKDVPAATEAAVREALEVRVGNGGRGDDEKYRSPRGFSVGR